MPSAQPFHQPLFWAGLATFCGALLHVAIVLGGPAWYAAFGAPAGLVELARQGHPRAALSALVIAALLTLWSAYAFSGVGLLRRLPLLRAGLALIAALLLLRGLLFVPLALWAPAALARVCDCRGADAFVIGTSLLCLALGLGYALGAWRAGRRPRPA